MWKKAATVLSLVMLGLVFIPCVTLATTVSVSSSGGDC